MLHFKSTPDSRRLRKLLKTLGLSQREAGRGLGVGARYMRNLCAGSEAVPAAIFLALEKLVEDRRKNDGDEQTG